MIKVYPISLIRQKIEKGTHTAQFGQIQANIDANEELDLAPVGMDVFATDKPRRVAVVGFGPSLVRTWERLREFEYIWTTSGAHDFLVKRGIVPKWHTDVNWRPHKAGLIFFQCPRCLTTWSRRAKPAKVKA